MLIDMHSHSNGISLCCQMDTKSILQKAKMVGIDGIILTNHYQQAYLENITFEKWKQKYVEEYLKVLSQGKDIGVNVFFSTEISMSFDERVHLLIYGIQEDDFIRLPKLYDFSQKELYDLCENNGWLLVQAHPYRNGTTPLNPKYLHGVEINCLSVYGNAFAEELIGFAKEYKLLLTCGCDFHGGVDYRPYGGMVFPNNVKNINDIVNHLKSSSEKIIYEQEIKNREIRRIINKRNKSCFVFY